MRENEKKWVTSVTTRRDWGERTTFFYTDRRTRALEYEYGVGLLDGDDVLMYVRHDSLITIEFDAEDPNVEA
jgi:hypothetical protein